MVAAGAAGVLFPAAFAGEALPSLVGRAQALGAEPVVSVSNAEEAEAALEAGCRLLVFSGLSVDDAIQLRESLVKQHGETAAGAHVCKLRQDHMPSLASDMESSWVLRDAGFSGVWPTENMYKNGMDDIHTGIFAMGAKASRKFCSTTAFTQKAEGAREFLGELLD
mmetsp:Transcript_3055/g.10545  ORF Transcript_3055/g.10545 Transcript_3055/m.10545 type:complete len:166 (+) Transcript_3055:2-499(+)